MQDMILSGIQPIWLNTVFGYGQRGYNLIFDLVKEHQPSVRTFGFNVVLLLFINVLIKPFYLFGIDRTVQNDLGQSAYGMYWTFFNFIFLFQIVADFGIQNFSQQWISRQRRTVQTTFQKTITVKLFLSGIFIVVLVIAGWIIGYLQHQTYLYTLLGISFLANSWVLYLRTTLSGLGYYTADSLISALDKLIVIGIMSYFIWLQPAAYDLTTFVMSQILAYAIVLLFLLWWVRSHIRPFKIKWRWDQMRVILRKTFPYALIFLLMTIFTRIDVVMIERFSENGFSESGIYAGGMRILDAANILGFVVAGLLLPMFSHASRQKEPPIALAQAGWNMLLAIAIPIAVVCWLYGQDIVEWLYVEGNEYWGQVLSILMLTFVVRSSDYIFGSLLTAYERLHFMNRVFLIGIVVNISLNLILIPAYNAIGAAIATLITQSMVAVVFMIYAHRHILRLSLWHSVKNIMWYASCIAGLGILMYLFGLDWRLEIILIGGCALLLSWVFSFIQPLFGGRHSLLGAGNKGQ